MASPSKGAATNGEFTLNGSPHSLPTYRIALDAAPVPNRVYLSLHSFQRGMHLTPEFRALSLWGHSNSIFFDEAWSWVATKTCHSAAIPA